MTYLRNGWYAAAFSGEVGRAPLARTLLDVPMVLYRLEDGAPVALHDRCPHRFAPLSRGTLIGDEIQCPYHGLRFGREGSCTYNPHYDALPKAARTQSFALLERYGLVWLWGGPSEKADPALLPDFGFLTDETRFSTVSGYLHIKANYQLIVDNLLDLTHAPFLHPAFAVPGVSVEERLRGTRSELIRERDRISAIRLRPNSPPNGPTRTIFGFTDERMDSRSNMHWFPPALLHFDLGAAPVGGREEDGLCIPAAHAITPETELTSHYFFAQARNVKREDAEVDAQLLALLDTAFREQDEPMIEAQQARMGNVTNISDLQPVLLKTDAAPVAARRLLAALIASEQSEPQLSALEIE